MQCIPGTINPFNPPQTLMIPGARSIRPSPASNQPPAAPSHRMSTKQPRQNKSWIPANRRELGSGCSHWLLGLGRAAGPRWGGLRLRLASGEWGGRLLRFANVVDLVGGENRNSDSMSEGLFGWEGLYGVSCSGWLRR